VPQVRTDVGAVYGVLSHFADEGSGEALVLIHGGGVAAQGHLGWTAAIGPLSQQYRVIAPDLLWSGLTDKPAAPYSFRAQVDHVAGLLDALGIERAHILGQSIGAYLAARFACDYPQRTGRLVLVGSNTVAMMMGVDVGADKWTEESLTNDMHTPESMRRHLQTLRANHDSITADVIDANLQAEERAGHRDLRRAMVPYVLALAGKEPALWQEVSLEHRLPTLGIPTCLIWGRDDQFASVSLGRQVRELLPEVDYHEIADASHHVFQDQTDEFCRIVTGFLSGTRIPASR
jgi:pimeloyl-ACP methyl ester carboxylesterase